MRFLSFALLSVLTACGGASSSSFQKADEVVLPEGTIVDDATAEKIVGVYAALVNIHSESSLPIFGKTAADNQLLRISTISKNEEGGLSLYSKGCQAKFLSSGPLKLTVDDAIIAALPEQTTPLRAWSVDGVVNFAQDTQVLVAGATLVNPATDKLPTDAKDPRITKLIDVKVNGGLLASGTIGIVQRSASSFEGALQDNGELVAVVTDKTEQSIVKSTNPLLRVKLPEAKQVIEKSYVRMVKLPADTKVDCAAVDFAEVFAD